MNGAIPPHVLAAWLSTGGCKCTPQPWLACDTCGRPIAPWCLTVPMVTAFDWQATLIDGPVVTKRDVISIDNVPKDRMADLKVATTSPRAPVVHVRVDPRKGETLHMFTRHVRGIRMDGAPGGGVSVVVLEIAPDPSHPERTVRLYVHPERLIFSTQEIYFP